MLLDFSWSTSKAPDAVRMAQRIHIKVIAIITGNKRNRGNPAEIEQTNSSLVIGLLDIHFHDD